MYTPKGAVCKSEFIRVARLIMAGDLDMARKILRNEPCSYYCMGVGYGQRPGWYQKGRTIPEARAINGACRAAEKLYGIKLDPWYL